MDITLLPALKDWRNREAETSRPRRRRLMHGVVRTAPHHVICRLNLSFHISMKVDKVNVLASAILMATEKETLLVNLIRGLSSAILNSISDLIPTLQDKTQASQLCRESQRLLIWGNDLGIRVGEVEKLLEGEDELQYSIVTLHMMIAQSLITAAEVTATIDRLLRLAPFLEQYMKTKADETVPKSNNRISELGRTEAEVYIDRILTRFPQASHEHVRTIADSRLSRMKALYSQSHQCSHSTKEFDAESKLEIAGSDHKITSQGSISDSELAKYLESIEQTILDDTEIPFPSLPKSGEKGDGEADCGICGKKIRIEQGTRKWRSHIVEDYRPYICLEKHCPYGVALFSHLLDFHDHSKVSHGTKLRWTCKLCGSKTFAARSQLQYHSETVHYIPADAAIGLCELWQEEIPTQEGETECFFCSEGYGSQPYARITHLARHMIEIALLNPVPVPEKETANWKRLIDPEMSSSLPLLPKSIPVDYTHKAELQSRPFHFLEDTFPLSNVSPRTTAAEDFKVAATPPQGGLEEQNEADIPHSPATSAGFTLEELHSDDDDCLIPFQQPTSIEEPDDQDPTRVAEEPTPISKLEHLCDISDGSDEEEQQRVYRRKKKRWSAGIFKRSYSQSVEADSDEDDFGESLESHDVGSSARRLRRRVRGPGDRSSLIFEDMGLSIANNIAEVEEPQSERIYLPKGPPSIPSDDDNFTLDQLPFWTVSEPMDLEIDSS
ncbi:uncharacterized protein BDR25DRAFT_338747 [Lindgomyces ingoldianus]|uniref:Uncharacterized protein n=1 Tax=Lindgomyces ingoldianus TaxID=673940 RepID=A0ACB6RH15_9PLEO|nr:uncharacterized protein BDR25DRAFT_338747 [Lindgomyces ingoldianus]KAF2478073.1 hypothetical protein BDR25DRAFT_338747 [Lindgomyces ingoldianus]